MVHFEWTSICPTVKRCLTKALCRATPKNCPALMRIGSANSMLRSGSTFGNSDRLCRPDPVRRPVAWRSNWELCSRVSPISMMRDRTHVSHVVHPTAKLERFLGRTSCRCQTGVETACAGFASPDSELGAFAAFEPLSGSASVVSVVNSPIAVPHPLITSASEAAIS